LGFHYRHRASETAIGKLRFDGACGKIAFRHRHTIKSKCKLLVWRHYLVQIKCIT
jgi:hypothetical protein